MAKQPPKLKDPSTAAFLSWLVPGLGQVYQGRLVKGLLLWGALWGAFFYGLQLGEWKVVYLQWDRDNRRYAYLCQVFIGAAAVPALVQYMLKRSGRGPWWRGYQAAPDQETLDDLYRQLGRRFEIGTVYTMIAGLLNILVIYDAYAGAAYARLEEQEEEARGAGAKQEASA